MAETSIKASKSVSQSVSQSVSKQASKYANELLSEAIQHTAFHGEHSFIYTPKKPKDQAFIFFAGFDTQTFITDM